MPLQLDGKVTSGPDLSVQLHGMKLPNPFVIGSGPPGTNYKVMKKAFDEGWGAVIAKTLSLDHSKVINVTPRYARLKAADKKQVIGWENIELISDRPLKTMLQEFRQLKAEYPKRALIASISEEYNEGAWADLVGQCEEAGVDGFELNLSCPQGLPERGMGMAIGQDNDKVATVCGWVHKVATKPVWSKMSPNVTDIKMPARSSLSRGIEGIAAINTIQSVMGINLKTLRPEPTVEGYSTPGGYSSAAVKPIALAKVMQISTLIKQEFDGARDLSAIGGVETGQDAAEFLLLGANSAFMRDHDFKSIEEFRGHSLPYFTTHTELVRMQREAIAAKKKRVGLENDADWSGDGFVQQSDSMVAN
eukprot:jgi/Astpho2/5647/Aster-02895